jgi:4-hydroxy-2-oxoheptanedioate aldolase
MYAGHSFGVEEATYAAEADDNLLVMVQIESQSGVDNVEEIAQVPGLDVLFIGPFDLSKSMNVPFGSEAHNTAIERILAAAHKYGKTAATFCTNGEQARARLEQGFDMVSVTTDVGCLVTEMTRQLAVAAGTPVEKKSGGYS